MSEENFYQEENNATEENNVTEEINAAEAEKRPEVSLKKPQPEADSQTYGAQQGIYKENDPQQRGEYRDAQSAWQNSTSAQCGYPKYLYENNPYQQEPYQPASQGFGIASLVLGVLSLVLFCSCINVLLAILAIVFGVIQLSKPDSKKGMAIAGIITSIASIVLLIVLSVFLATSTDFQEGLQRGLENGLDEDFYEDYFYEQYGYPSFDDDDPLDTF